MALIKIKIQLVQTLLKVKAILTDMFRIIEIRNYMKIKKTKKINGRNFRKKVYHNLNQIELIKKEMNRYTKYIN